MIRLLWPAPISPERLKINPDQARGGSQYHSNSLFLGNDMFKLNLIYGSRAELSPGESEGCRLPIDITSFMIISGDYSER